MHNEELRNLYSTPHIATVTKPTNMRWVEYVACMGEIVNTYKTVARKL
jgi:phosphoglycerate dehydrogenase-like enzyme